MANIHQELNKLFFLKMEKVVLITGGAKGIGRAIVRQLASEGYRVAINYYSSKDEALRLKDELKQHYAADCLCLKADVAKEEEVEAMVKTIIDKWGRIDALINNAAIDLANLFNLKNAAEFRRTLDVNVVGAYNCAMAVAADMKKRSYGRIINISSTNGINTYYPMSFDYDASKAALNSLTHNLAVQFAPSIHVNAIAPGFIGTESELDGYDEAFLKAECEKILVGRYGYPEEVADLVSFLLSDKANYINNAIIRIDGGQNGSC